MHNKPLLNLRLNYAYQNLTPAFKIIVSILGSVLFIVSVMYFIKTPELTFWANTSAILNLALGIILIILSSKKLPNFASKFIKITHNLIILKLTVILPQRKIHIDLIEELEIDRKYLKFRLENRNKPLILPLHNVSYSDFEVLQKSLIDICHTNNIDVV